ncbi:AI-2E family transporter [Methylocella sp.]|uniref:AI-2E family transporter n=1 Tax=Methylocella sp. TaxID=1978226 RepID=UPI0037848EB8
MSDVFEGPHARPAGRRDLARTVEILSILLIAALCVVALYAARGVFVPIAIAVLLSFVLSIPMRALRRVGFSRLLAALVVVFAALAATFAASVTVTRQVADLAASLPQYQETFKAKASALRGLLAANSALERGADLLRDIGDLGKGASDKGISGEGVSDKGAPAAGGNAGNDDAAQAPQPVPVVVHEPAPNALSMLQTILGTALSPLETIAVVAIFVIFILLQREDLRNRFIRLAGSGDLQRASVAMNDAASRLSRYFLVQFLVNATFGAVVAVGLSLIGVPGAILFGLIGFMMRFVPYIGAIITAALPVALAAAVDPGWTMALETAAMFVVVEVAVGHFIEPMLYGRNTGLSPIAVVVSATFWTWLWGPVGLVLSTPLTVCLVVLGRHVEQLGFLDVMLGDAPPLTPAAHFYQRALVEDASEIADQAEAFLKDGALVSYYDEVALPGLMLAEADARRGSLAEERRKRVRDTVKEVVEDLDDHEDAAAREGGEPPAVVGEDAAPRLRVGTRLEQAPPDPEPPRKPVLCVGGRGALDEAAAAMLAQILEKHGMTTKVEPPDLLRVGGVLHHPGTGPQMICLSYVGREQGAAHMRYAVRRLRRRLPNAKIVVGAWGAAPAAAEELCAQTRADACVTSFAEAARLFAQEAQAAAPAPEAPLAVPTPPVFDGPAPAAA